MRGATAVHRPIQLAKSVTGSEAKTSLAQAQTIDEPNPQPMSRLPAHARNILRIKVPVTVTLASDQCTVHRILEFAPGTLLQFKKPCDEPLALSVGDCEVAVGEAVTVGERLALRITSMVQSARRA
jgi:flagellar motor switch/type III secretory pathway protein FliN